MARKTDYTIKVDYEVGRRVHELRIGMGLSRQQLAFKIEVTHQQLQKYEKGTNRISAGRLAAVAKAMNKPVAFFFEEEVIGHSEHQRMCIEVSRNFLKIKNPEHQSAINDLLRILAGGK